MTLTIFSVLICPVILALMVSRQRDETGVCLCVCKGINVCYYDEGGKNLIRFEAISRKGGVKVFSSMEAKETCCYAGKWAGMMGYFM